MHAPDLIIDEVFEPAHEQVLRWLCEHVAWDERMRARKTASYGVPYDYSGISYPQAPMPDVLLALARRLAARLGYRPNNCLLNCYESGAASMGFHSDSEASVEPGTDVAIVSLGSARTLRFRCKADRSVLRDYRLEPGSLVIMRPASQQLWQHAVPPEVNAGLRISATFRRLVTTAT